MRSSRPRARLIAGCALVLALALSATAAAAKKDHAKRSRQADPIVIGHRGASGYRPEHTLASYELAARMGADYVEPDLVSTRDHALVARHEPDITATTNVADHPEFAGRKTTKTIDGVTTTGWFTDDFTLAELRTLRAKERLPDGAPAQHDLRRPLQGPHLPGGDRPDQAALARAAAQDRDLPRDQAPHLLPLEGLALEGPLVRTLRANDLDGRKAKVFVQSFETRNLKMLNKRIDVPLVALLDAPTKAPADRAGRGTTYADLATPAGLRRIAEFADGVGPSKDYVIPRDAAGRSKAPTSFVRDAHRAGLLVHPYTFRPENQFLPAELRSSADPNAYGNLFKELDMFFAAGVDGVFTDTPDIAVETLRERGGR
ncbi:MAG: glycerophosphodiester phosphodiesterase family protein [Thermoleophilaceae bacterium]